MKVVFVSNYYSQHQKEFSINMSLYTNNEFYFIETCEMNTEREKLGWKMYDIPSYVIKSHTSDEDFNRCQKLIDDADVVIIGSAPYKLIENRLKEKKLTFLYSERIYKIGFKWYKMPLRILLHYLKFGRHKSLYMLCASAFTASDYSKTFTFLKRAFKWGYFPPIKKYDDLDKLIENKKKKSILWCARFIDWKHPEMAVELAYQLKNAGYEFNLTLLGNGELYEKIKSEVENRGLCDYVSLPGSVKQDEVRSYMEEAEIFIFTSDKNEGWGAVLNEAMNSACAAVASHQIGSAPFLIKDKENGLIFKNQDIDDLYNKVTWLIDNEDERKKISKKAYITVTNEWNAANATVKFLKLAKEILDNGKTELFESGVCSRAEILSDRWYKGEKNIN